MALNLDERYPGRANGKTLSYPQGSFKNRSSPTAKDGTYLEQDWANDLLAFFQSLIKEAGLTANGAVDTVGASQYFDALQTIISEATPDASETVKGLIQLATTEEAQALTDDEHALTAKKLHSALTGAAGEALISGRLINVRRFTATTVYTPTPGTKSIVVEVQGGGGAGGGAPNTVAGYVSAGSGGGGGGYCLGRVLTGFAGADIVVGAGGVPVSGAAGGAGGSSSFLGFSSGGGGGGGAGAAVNGTALSGGLTGLGGGATNGLVFSPGQAGGVGLGIGGAPLNGDGGNSMYGSGGGFSTGSVNGGAGRGFGGGGSGAVSRDGGGTFSGGAGAPGIVIIWEYA